VESAEAIAEAVQPRLAGRFGHMGSSHLRSLSHAWAALDAHESAAESASVRLGAFQPPSPATALQRWKSCESCDIRVWLGATEIGP
jgi:hypothetical protein